MRKIAVALIAVALSVAAGCIPGEPGAASPETKRPATAVEEPTEEPTPVAEKEEIADPKLGETYVYEDGVEITVFKPVRVDEPYKGETWEDVAAYGEKIPKGTTPVKITMKITNGSSRTIDPSGSLITVLADDKELMAECFGEVDCYVALTKLRPGRSISTSSSYFLPKGSALTVEASPTFEHDPALYS